MRVRSVNRFGAQSTLVQDLFRLRGDLIVEHWDVTEPLTGTPKNGTRSEVSRRSLPGQAGGGPARYCLLGGPSSCSAVPYGAVVLTIGRGLPCSSTATNTNTPLVASSCWPVASVSRYTSTFTRMLLRPV